MKSVVVCSSSKFNKDVKKFVKGLKDLGVTVYRPLLETWYEQDWDSLTPELQRVSVRGLTLGHFKKINKADVVFLYNKGGYSGTSVSMELGYAVALEKPIYALEKDTKEIPRDILLDDYVDTPEKLVEKLK